jgi:fumarate reductase flavoprotein subunit
LTVDVLVVGAGMAGSVAATRAATLGASTLLVDLSEDTTVAGNTVLAGGSVHLVHQPLDADPELLRDGIYGQGWDETGAELVEAMVVGCAPALRWVVKQGVTFQPKVDGEQRGLVPAHCALSPPKDRGDAHGWFDRGPHRALRVLQERFRQAGGKIRAATTVRELLHHAGSVAGVVTEDGQQLAARTVIIADGGFASSAPLRRRFIGPAADRLFLRGTTAGTGAGILMGEAAGARLTNTSWIYGHLMHRDVYRNDRLWPWPLLDGLLAAGGVLVNAKGRRITDEGRGGIWAANVLAHSEDPTDAFLVVDEALWQEAGRNSREPVAANPAFQTRGATIHRARDLPELAKMAAIDSAGLARTFDQYSVAAAQGRAADLPILRSRGARPLTGALLAFPAAAGISFTMGGLRIDGRSRVLDDEERPIPGLLAAGGAAAGPTAGYIGGLATALVFGLIAGQTAAQESWDDQARRTN